MKSTDSARETGGEAREVVEGLRSEFRSGLTRSAAWRRSQLAQLRRALVEGQDELLEALRADLGKSSTEAYATEIGFTLAQTRHMEAHIGQWMAPQRVPLELALRPGRARVVPEPLGVVLVIAPWNLPVQLLVVGASGMGAYHGRHGFDTFSHHRAVLERSTRFDLPVMYPPIGALKEQMMRRFM